MEKDFLTSADVSRNHNHHYVDASELHWPPGQLLREIPTDLGNGLPFKLLNANDDAFTYYQQYSGLTLTIYND